jgi:hypothetical protein
MQSGFLDVSSFLRDYPQFAGTRLRLKTLLLLYVTIGLWARQVIGKKYVFRIDQ